MIESPLDLMLEWLSERGEGSWGSFRDAFAWLRVGASLATWDTASFAARQMSSLGHLEIDWVASRWAASPPVLTLLPSAGAHALLTGGRTRELSDRLTATLDRRSDVYGLDPIEQDRAPSARLIACEDETSVRSLASELEVEFSHSVSERIAAILPSLSSYLELTRSMPAPRGYGIQRLDEETLDWSDVEEDGDRGLYRYQAPAGPEFRLLRDGGLTSKVDLSVGVYGALAGAGQKERLKWFRSSVNGDLEVPLRAPLPTLHARAACLCSGMAPQRRGKTLVYVNVPHHVAQALGRSLDQSIRIIEQ